MYIMNSLAIVSVVYVQSKYKLYKTLDYSKKERIDWTNDE